ncbi:hypothetical protein A6395_13305 [Exiguobacterium sp. SH31]|uniref:hypothetical protein n=1 Tax=Exiguobacterium sp. SH31 TaxID=1843183 RepID=UPI0008BFA692|nr:hypothetical protein [Exiguobacterium sp. SH31]OGX78193.1 hypothetical protein A6395_13305 [Exiguobacterium sp. SH31]
MAETKKLVIIKKEGKKALEVSRRLFDVYYKGLGYKKVEPEASKSVDDNGKGPGFNPDGIVNDKDELEGDELPAYDDITKAEIVERLKDDGIDHNPRDSKEVLYALLEGE